MITIVNYGLGNLASVKNMIKSIGSESQITSDIHVILINYPSQQELITEIFSKLSGLKTFLN